MKKVASPLFAEIERHYLTTEEAAQELGMSAKRLRNMRTQGKGPKFVRVHGGKAIRYRYSDLVAWYFGFEDTEVFSAGTEYKVCNPTVDYEVHLYGEKGFCLAANLHDAMEKIRCRITQNIADGSVWSEYHCNGLKARLYFDITDGREHATYAFMAE